MSIAKFRLPAPKDIEPTLGQAVVFAEAPGRTRIGKLVGFIWQEDRPAPPGESGAWAWIEVHVEFGVAVEIKPDADPYRLPPAPMSAPSGDRLN